MSDQLTSPVGQILFLAVNQPVKNSYSGKDEYTARMMFDGSTPEGKAFKAALHSLNKKLVGPQEPRDDVPAGWFTVNAKSDYKPQVVDGQGEAVTEVPYFTKGSTGQAIVHLKTFQGEKGGSVKLTGIAILDLELAESEPKENVTKTSLIEALAKANKIKTS